MLQSTSRLSSHSIFDKSAVCGSPVKWTMPLGYDACIRTNSPRL